MSDTPKDPGAGSGENPEYRDPTAPTWDDGDRTGQAGPTASGSESAPSSGEQTEAVPTESTQQLPPQPPTASEQPSGQSPYGQPPNPYEQAQNPYAAGAPGGYPTSRPGPPPVPGAPGTAGAGFPSGPPPAYGQSGYGQPAGAQPGYGQPSGGQPYGQVSPYGGQPGYAPSPYAKPRGTTNTSAIALLVVSGISTLVGCFFAIPALVLGIMAVAKQNQSPQEASKFTRWGWIAYAIAIAFVVIGGIIAIAIFASTGNSTGY
jgi:hypothetical protein